MQAIKLREAQQILLAHTTKIADTESVGLWDIQGRVLAEDIIAARSQPPFPRSPLDGYAVRSVDIAGADETQPVRLTVIDEVLAGHTTEKQVGEKEAIRIMTGAPIPTGADCIVRQEDTDYGEKEVQIYTSLKPYENYCLKGEDYQAGTKLLSAGLRLGAVEAGILASLGYTQVLVYRQPAVALLTTGDEAILPGEELQPGKIYDSNLYALGSQIRNWGAELREKGSLEDDVENVAEWIRKAAKKVDLLVTTGGVSVGKKDIMHEVLVALGCEKLFWKIAIKPGMPTLCAIYQGKLLICLSGNPFGAVANLELLVRPVLAEMMGREDLRLQYRKAKFQGEFLKASKVMRYLRANYEQGTNVVRKKEGSNASGILSSMSGCNCLIEIPAGTKCLEPEAEVEVILL